MSTRIRVGVVAGLIALGAVVPGGIASARTAPTAKWTVAVCRSFATWQHALADSLGAVSASPDLINRKTEMSGKLHRAVKATATLVSALKSAGNPAVGHGAALASALRSAATNERRALAAAERAAHNLPTTDQAAFTQALGQLEARYAASGRNIEKALNRVLDVPDVNHQLATQAACTAL